MTAIGEHHRQNDAGIDKVLERRRHRRSRQQHIDQDVVKLVQEAQQRPLRARRLQPVRPVRRAPAGGFRPA